MSDEVRVKVGGKEYAYKKDESNVIPFMKTKGIVKTVTLRIKDEAKEV